MVGFAKTGVLTATLIMLGFPIHAQASDLTINLPLNVVLKPGQSYTKTLDFSSFESSLANIAGYNFYIQSATMSLNASSPFRYTDTYNYSAFGGFTQVTYTYPCPYMPLTICTGTTNGVPFYNNYSVDRDSVEDSAKLSSGTNTKTVSSANVGYNSYYGAIAGATINADAAELQSGLIGFSLTALTTNSEIDLNGVTFDLSIQQGSAVPLHSQQVTPVPEAAIWLTMVAGFGLTGVSLRASRQRRAAAA